MTEVSEDNPRPPRKRLAHTPAIAGSIAQRPCREIVTGTATANRTTPTTAIGTRRPARSAAPRTAPAMCIHKAVES